MRNTIWYYLYNDLTFSWYFFLGSFSYDIWCNLILGSFPYDTWCNLILSRHDFNLNYKIQINLSYIENLNCVIFFYTVYKSWIFRRKILNNKKFACYRKYVKCLLHWFIDYANEYWDFPYLCFFFMQKMYIEISQWLGGQILKNIFLTLLIFLAGKKDACQDTYFSEILGHFDWRATCNEWTMKTYLTRQ